MKIKIIIGVMLIVLLVGCDGGEEKRIESVFEGGSQGLVARFELMGVLEGGKYTIFDTDTFPIEVTLENKGETDVDVGDAVVTLKGIPLSEFDNIPYGNRSNIEEIEKVSEFNPQGGETIIDFTPLEEDARYKRDVTGFYDVNIFAEYKYNYQTNLILPEVCFKEDPRDASVCSLTGNKEFFVSGAPITLTSVQQEEGGRGIVVLIITVKNVGGGKGTIEGEEFDPRYDQISYTISDAENWECKSGGRENEARLVGGVATIRCKLKESLPKDTLYTKQVEMTLDYVYKGLISETLRIKESLR